MTNIDPATRADKIRASVFVFTLPALLLVIATISMWNGHGDLW